MSISTTLGAAVAATDAAITVSSIGDFDRVDAPFGIAIDGEELTVADNSTTTWPVERSIATPPTTLFIDRFDREETAGYSHGVFEGKIGHWYGDIPDADHNFYIASGIAVATVLTAGAGCIARFSTDGIPLNIQHRYRFLCQDNLEMQADARVRQSQGGGVEDYYRPRLTIDAAGAMSLRLASVVAGVGTNLASAVVPPGTVALDEWVWLATQVTGASPTQFSAKAWRELDGEPAAWQTTVSDSTASLQDAGDLEFRLAPTTGTAVYNLADYTLTSVPLAPTHANGATVVLIEEWDTPNKVGMGPPRGSPRSGSTWLDVEPALDGSGPPVQYVRAGANWYTSTAPLA